MGLSTRHILPSAARRSGPFQLSNKPVRPIFCASPPIIANCPPFRAYTQRAMSAPDRAPTNAAPSTSGSAQNTVLAWLMPPLFLSSIGLGLWLISNPPENIFAWTAGFFVALGLLWILVSTVFPRGVAERICPACGADTLVRADPAHTRGKVCSTCLWKDESVSSFLMAEEDDAPLEADILARRRKNQTPVVIRPWTGPAVVRRRDSDGAASSANDSPHDSK